MKKTFYPKENGKLYIMGGLKLDPQAEELLERLGYEIPINPFNKTERVCDYLLIKEDHFDLFKHVNGTPRIYGNIYLSEKGKKLLECWESL